jgi:hypothetical protein
MRYTAPLTLPGLGRGAAVDAPPTSTMDIDVTSAVTVGTGARAGAGPTDRRSRLAEPIRPSCGLPAPRRRADPSRRIGVNFLERQIEQNERLAV